MNGVDPGDLMRCKKLIGVLVLAAPLALPAVAGVTYTAKTRTLSAENPDQAADLKVRALVNGSKARVDFLESELPELAKGRYLLSTDEGKTVYLVDPAGKTFARWDAERMVSGMADLMRRMRWQMKVHFDEPQIQKVLDEKGEPVAGLPTRHYRYRTSYRVRVELAGSDTIATTVDEDIWTTSAVQEPGLRLWLKQEPPTSGDEQLDRIIHEEKSKIQGFPVKKITVIKTTDHEGKVTESRTEMIVTEMKTISVEDSAFQIPSGYTEMDLSKRQSLHPE